MNRNILYIGNDLFDKTGYFSAMENLCRNLAGEGYHVKKASDKDQSFNRLFDMILHVLKYRKWVDVVLIDTFSTNSFYYAFAISQLCRLFKIRYIPILHGGNLPERIQRSKSLSGLLFNHSFCNVSPSGYLKNEFARRGFHCKLIPNSIHLADFNFKQRQSINPNILFVRAFHQTYNPQMAIEVLSNVCKTYPEAKLCMVGPKKDHTLKEVKELIHHYGLNNKVEITGTLEKHEWYKRSESFDIFINTTNVDNTPVSIIEAMALGIPIISTNVGGIPYLIENDKEGILVEKNSADQMTKAIIRLVKTNDTSMSVNARKKAESFSWDHIKPLWFEVLQKI